METIARISRHRWLTMAPSKPDPDIVARCSVEIISTALEHLSGVSVQSVRVNPAGSLHVPENEIFSLPSFVIEDLPDYCEVVVHDEGPGGHVALVTVWVPLVWNGRFLGTGGAGNRSTFGHLPGDEIRGATLANAVQNGFASARTDAAVGDDPRQSDWQFNEETGENDHELIENWVHRSTHNMTVIGKAVTAAIHGSEPRYSYLQSGSGGGRQSVAQVLHHPANYDGVWATDPAINWTKFVPSDLWPALVMKELDNALPPAKFEAFRQAAVDDFNKRNGTSESFTTSDEPPVFDAYRVVGRLTDAGEITEADAQVMKMIWDGPRTPDGEQLWFGLRPGTESWGTLTPGIGTCVTYEDAEGILRPKPFELAATWFGTWILNDPEWDWTTLTFAEYARLFKKGVEEFAHVAIDSPDLSELRDSGGRLLLTHGISDQVIPPEGSRQYFDRMLDTMGGTAATSEFVRLFLCPGDGHGSRIPGAPSLDLATGMIALMKWVEEGVAPDSLDLPNYTEDGKAVDGTIAVNVYGSSLAAATTK